MKRYTNIRLFSVTENGSGCDPFQVAAATLAEAVAAAEWAYRKAGYGPKEPQFIKAEFVRDLDAVVTP